MLLFFIKALLLLILLALAFACIQNANALNKYACGCRKSNLILIIIGTTTFAATIIYACNYLWILLSVIPLMIGFTLNLLMNDAATHYKINFAIDSIKTKFKSLRTSD